MSIRCLSIVSILISSFPAIATAMPSLTISQEFIQEYDAAFNPLGVPDMSVGHPPGHYYQLRFSMQLNGLVAGEDFASVEFNVLKSHFGLTAVDFGSGFYSPIGGNYDSNGPASGGTAPHWQVENADPANNDLQAIRVAVAANEAGNRQYGESTRPAAGSADLLGLPTAFGEVFYQDSGLGWTFVLPPFATVSMFQIWTNNTVDGGGTLVTVPECGTLAVFSIALIGLMPRHRRELAVAG